MPARPPVLSRWSASAWTFLRRGEAAPIATGGMLGGSQFGARLGYRINEDVERPLALSGRIYSPLENARGAELALGLEWKPSAKLPVRVLAERRQALDEQGRSAFSLMAYGGVHDRTLGPFRLDAYGQAGVVGVKARDLFADGSASLRIPLSKDGRLSVGVGVWGAAQPGVSRLDAGPSLTYRLPIEGRQIRISADWRVRVAGDGAPGSGPALTIGTDF